MGIKKCLIIIFLLAILIQCFSSVSYASSNMPSIGESLNSADNFLNIGKSGADNTLDEQQLNEVSSFVFNAFLAVGTVIAVIIGSVLGIQFMLASAEGKAEIKQKLVPFIVGCVIIFGAFAIWKVVTLLVTSLS